jgi:hypothetical protein
MERPDDENVRENHQRHGPGERESSATGRCAIVVPVTIVCKRESARIDVF